MLKFCFIPPSPFLQFGARDDQSVATMADDGGQPANPSMANVALTSTDILRDLVSSVANNDFLFLALVSRDWREAWGERHTVTSFIPKPETSLSQLRHTFE